MTTLTLDVREPENLKATLHSIAQTAKDLFGADLTGILAINPIKGWFHEQTIIDDHAHGSDSSSDNEWLSDIVRKMLHSPSPLFIENLSGKPEDNPQLAGLKNIASLAGVVLYTRRSQRPLAGLCLGFRQARSFDAAERSRLESYAVQASSVLNSTWLLRRYHEAALIGQEINQETGSYESLFKILQRELADLLDTSNFLMMAVHQPETNLLDLYMSESGGIYKYEGNSAFSGGCARVMDEKKSLMISRFSEQPNELFSQFEPIPNTNEQPPESLILLPLLLNDRSLGVLSVQHMQANAFNEEDLQILELLSNQIALAISNQRMFNYLQSLNQTSQQLTQQLNANQLLQDVADRIRAATNADIVSFYPYVEREQRFDEVRLSGVLLHPEIGLQKEVRPDDIAYLTLLKGQAIWARKSLELYQKLGGDSNKRQGNFEEREKIRSTAALPLQIDGETVGVLFVNFRQPQRFSAAQKDLITSLAKVAAIAINNSREVGQIVSRRLMELDAFREIERQLIQTLNLKQLLQTILEKVAEHIPLDESAIFLYNSHAKTLKEKASRGRRTGDYKDYEIPVEEGKGLITWVYKYRVTARVNNVHQDPEWKSIYNPFIDDTVSEMDVPLLSGEEVVGVINLESTREAAFSQADQEFLEVIAVQAVLAIKNAQDYEHLSRIARELSAMQEIEREIIGQLGLQEVLDTILEKSLQLTKSTVGQIMLYDRERRDLYNAAERGVFPHKKEERMSIERGIVGWVVRHSQPLNENICEAPWKDVYVQYIPNVCWELAVPLLDGDKIYGAINIENPIEQPFSDDDERLLIKLASLAVIALQNAEQYEQASSGKRKIEALYYVDKEIIAQQGDPERIMRFILKSGCSLINAEIGYLQLYENEKPTKAYSNRNDEESVAQESDSLHTRSEYEGGIVELVARTKEPYITRGDAQADTAYRSEPGIHSEVAVPLLTVSAELIGVIHMASPRDFAFTGEHLEVLALLAGQAVISIQNARNFSQVDAASKRFRLLWQAGSELGEIIDLAQLHQAYEIVGFKVTQHNDGEVIIRRYDKNTEELLLACIKNQRATDPLPSIRCDEGVNGQVAREHRTIVIPDLNNLPEGVAQPIADSALKTLIVVPIKFKERYFGNLVLSHEITNYFNEDDVKLLEGLAHQLAITIDRLETVQTQIETGQQDKALEIFTEFSRAAYEITHRLGNELGLVSSYLDNIVTKLSAAGVDNVVIEEELLKISKDVGNVLNMSGGLKQTIDRLGEEGQLALDRTLIPTVTLLEDAGKTLSLPENVQLIWNIADDLPSVNVVREQVMSILKNLISNAIEAMTDGGQITIKAFNSPPNLRIEVADTGPGVPQNIAPNIFNLFFSTKKSAGFGLWSARHYARANCGDLALETQTGQGATFILNLPIADNRDEVLH